MNFIADESLDQPIVDYLRKNNYTVTAIAEMEPGLPDSQVFNMANESAVIFLASDQAEWITGQVLHVGGGNYM